MAVRYSKHLSSIVFLGDCLLLNFALYNAHFFDFNAGKAENEIKSFVVLSNLVWIFVSLLSKSFQVKRPLVLWDNVNRFLLTLIYHLLVILSIIFFLEIDDIPRAEIMISYSLFFLFIIVSRSLMFFFLDYYRKKGYNHRQILIIGDENIAARLVRSFSKHPEYGYDLADFISEDKISKMDEKALINIFLLKNPDEIFVCYKELNTGLLKRIIRFGDEHFIKIKVVSDLILSHNYAKLVNYDTVPVLQITSHPEISLKVRILKRSFDILFSCSIMIAGLPVFIIIFIITKLTSAGPAFYKQERIGRNEKPFYMYKFRSMYVNSEKHGPQLSKDNDPRITKWGTFIRKTRLDELPQFWNVLKGEMSVVGPRPERQHFIEKIVEKTPSYKKLLRLKPGITSIGQVHYGYAENIDQMCTRMRYDLIYLQKISLNSDLDIIYKTVKVMVQGKGK
jgi:putative colanic acid biosynthesis UDP-glucose lipid carrier transferase